MLYFCHASAEAGKDVKENTKDRWWRSTDPELTRQVNG
jgi:hypothetical protein